MRRFPRITITGFCCAAVAFSGCWMGGNTRPTPPAPQAPVPELGPPALTPAQPVEPLDAPALEGPSFPQSNSDAAPPIERFQRKRYTHQQPVENDMRPNYAGTQPQPIILDGPVAIEESAKSPTDVPRIGYSELPPSP